MLFSWWLFSIRGSGVAECLYGAVICLQKQGANSSWWQLLYRLQSLDRCCSSFEVQHGGCQSWVVVSIRFGFNMSTLAHFRCEMM